MARLLTLLLGIAALAATAAPAAAAGAAAQHLRAQEELQPFTPAAGFLSGYFVADEMTPAYIFGPVKDFAASRACPTAWLIDKDEQARLGQQASGEPLEYTIVLEEDCGEKVTHYVFVTQDAASADQWLAWRRQFHKSKTEGEYGETGRRYAQAAQDGFAPTGELRYISRNGDLLQGQPEALLTGSLGVKPIYDLGQGKAVGR